VSTLLHSVQSKPNNQQTKVIDGVMQSIKLITREASKKVAKYAFQYATANGKSKVTAAHKASIMLVPPPLFNLSCYLLFYYFSIIYIILFVTYAIPVSWCTAIASYSPSVRTISYFSNRPQK
jgi:hypothetical protein